MYQDDVWATCRPETGEVAAVTEDPKLPALARALAADEVLVGWRVGRRAVLRRPDGSWRKVSRPSKRDSVVASWAAAGRSSVATPEVLAVDDDGSLTISHQPGRSLRELDRDQARLVLPLVAQTIVEWHDSSTESLDAWQPTPARQWVDAAGRASRPFAEILSAAAEDLPPIHLATNRSGLVHADLHDKNIIIDGSTVSLIDVDDVRRGPIEVDTANLAAHLTLRSLQNGDGLAPAMTWSQEYVNLVAALCTLSPETTDALIRHTWFRLAALYFFRPGAQTLVPQLLSAATYPD